MGIFPPLTTNGVVRRDLRRSVRDSYVRDEHDGGSGTHHAHSDMSADACGAVEEHDPMWFIIMA